MYTPRPFAVGDVLARELLRDIVVGQLVTATQSGPMATLLPWVVDLDRGVLLGHVARPNPQWNTPWFGEAMVIAEGVNGYVSPSWYASKAEHGRVVPTWNYVVLQVMGELVVHDDAQWVDDVVRRLTDRHEQSRSEPWSVDDAPQDYLAGQLRAIVGVEIHIGRIDASVKMSQNKSVADVTGVANGFTSDGNPAAAAWVRRSIR
jgi:transcriptional regulator